MLCDKHVVKMSIEYAQILSTVHHLHLSPVAAQVYKQTHSFHPCVKWAGQSPSNYRWLFLHTIATWEEYTHRYGRVHRSSGLQALLATDPFSVVPASLGTLTHPPRCMPDQYKCLGTGNNWYNIVDSYRQYYAHEKAYMCTWKHREVPAWFEEYQKLFSPDPQIVVDSSAVA